MENKNVTSISRRHLLQTGAILASGSIAVPGLLTELAQAQARRPSAAGVQRWTVGNEQIERTLSFTPGEGLTTDNLTDSMTRTNFIHPTTSGRLMTYEFSFKCNGQMFRGTDAPFELLGADNSTFARGKSLTVRLRQKALDLNVAINYRVYNGHPAIRKSLALVNTGKVSLRISHLTIEAVGISLGPEYEMGLDAQYGSTPREMFYTGRSEDAALMLTNSRTRAGIAVVSEVPGYMKRTEIAGWDDADDVRITALYDTDLMPFERVIAPGETFTTAGVSLITYRRGDALRDPRWVMPSYTADVLMRRVNAQGPPWIYNTWEPFQRGINHEIVMALIDAASAMGLEIFTIDDGWQKEYGENAVDLKSFPGGLKAIQQLLESRGMRLGLWLPLAAIGRDTKDYREHPEWASRDLNGNEKTTGTMAGEKVVMCLASSFRESAADRVNNVIEQFNLAYVKLDLTTIFNAYGESPGCWANGHDHQDWSESLNRIYEGIAYVTGKVYEKHPDVLLDLTFELWGQKHLIDAGLLVAGDLDWLSNVDDTQPDSAGPIQARQLLYQRSASMPAESMLIGNIHAELPSKEESFATAIGSAPLLLGDLRKLNATDRQWYREKITWFRALRRRSKISESFFPLGSWRQTASDRWDGFARIARNGNGVIALFRNHSAAQSALVELPTMPPGSYRLRSMITGAELGSFAQADWAKGIAVVFSPASSVEVLEVSSS
jgi:alpha-galactosidase